MQIFYDLPGTGLFWNAEFIPLVGEQPVMAIPGSGQSLKFNAESAVEYVAVAAYQGVFNTPQQPYLQPQCLKHQWFVMINKPLQCEMDFE